MLGFGLSLGVLIWWLLTNWSITEASFNSICYLLSGLGQAQAAIVAIVATVTVVGFQLSPAYSTRMMDLFLGYKTFWGTVCAYGLSITFDFILLERISSQNIGGYIWHIKLAVISSALLFWLLLWLTRTTMWKIRPETVINDLVQEINGFERSQPKAGNATVFLYDMVKKAMTTYDFNTARYGVRALAKLCLAIDEPESGSIDYAKAEQLRREARFMAFCAEYAQDFSDAKFSRDLTKEICKSLSEVLQRKEYLKSEGKTVFTILASKLGENQFHELVEEMKVDGSVNLDNILGS